MTRAKILRIALALTLIAVPFVYALSQGPATGTQSATKPTTQLAAVTVGQSGASVPPSTLCASVAQPEIPACMASAPETLDAGGIPHHSHGYCRCSCGYPCMTSADCGGVSCDRFISCC